MLGAIVIPEDATDRLRRTLALSGGEPPTIEVYYNASDPLKEQLVETTINARLAEANEALSDAVLKEAAGYIDVIVTGGEVALPLVGDIDILGLRRSQAIIEAALREPAARRARAGGARGRSPASPAWRRTTSTSPSRSSATIGSPVAVKQTNVSGAKTSLSAFFVAVAVTVSLMFITLLLAAGMLALEREEHAFGRLVRGLVSRETLLGEKIGLAAACSLRRVRW